MTEPEVLFEARTTLGFSGTHEGLRRAAERLDADNVNKPTLDALKSNDNATRRGSETLSRPGRDSGGIPHSFAVAVARAWLLTAPLGRQRAADCVEVESGL